MMEAPVNISHVTKIDEFVNGPARHQATRRIIRIFLFRKLKSTSHYCWELSRSSGTGYAGTFWIEGLGKPSRLG